MTSTIDRFTGDYEFLSNFYPALTVYAGGFYPTAEHAFQAAKNLDPLVRAFVGTAATPGDAKRRGRTLELRPDWEAVKDDVMYDVAFNKFALNPHLLRKLLATGDAILVEGNTWGDTYWGVCRGAGRNKLGYTLMNTRGRFRQMPETTRVCVKHDTFDVYMGRDNWCPEGWAGPGADGCFGNHVGTIEAFRGHFAKRIEDDDRFRADVALLRGKRLGCWCDSEKDCHVEVYLDWLAGGGEEASDGNVLASMAARLGGGK